MKKELFFEQLQEIMEVDDEIGESTNLKEIEEYDSLAVLSLIAFFDEKFQKKVEAESFEKVETVRDLMELVGMDRFN